MTTQELLLALKDIHAPTPPIWWQVAPIYWFLAVFMISAIGFYLFLKRRRKSRHHADLARRELEALIIRYNAPTDSHRLLQALAGWLKRVALLAYPNAQLEALSGKAWLEFLDRSQGDDEFSRGAGKVFGDMVYRERADYNNAEIIQLCRKWMAAVGPQLHHRGQS